MESCQYFKNLPSYKKTTLLTAFVLYTLNTYAGTPGMNDTAVLYLMLLLFLGGIVGVNLLLKYILRRRNKNAETKNDVDFFEQDGL